ncbi:retrotransposon-related protein [Tanacetum coccineum]
MQGVTIEVDLYVLPMQGPDVVLGIQWLQNLGKVTHDYAAQTMEFTLLNTTYSLKGDESLRMKKISLHETQALLDQDEVYGLYEIHSLAMEAEVEETQPGDVACGNAELTKLLERFDSLFQIVLSTIGYATMATPLNGLLRKDDFKWGVQEASAFKGLKQQLSTAPVLSLPDFNEVFVIEGDASANGIGVVLFQNSRSISYFSRKLGPRMRITAMYQKELFAIVEAVYKWRQYLVGRYEDEETISASFMALSQPVVGFFADLKEENASLLELRSSKVAVVDELLVERDGLMRRLKQNLLEARNRMEVKANRNRRDVEFNVGDKIVERIGKVAYRLALPNTSKTHPVFHVSILKLFSVLRNGSLVLQVLVQWDDRSPKESTWERMSDFKDTYPSYNLEDKVISEEGEMLHPRLMGWVVGSGPRKHWVGKRSL